MLLGDITFQTPSKPIVALDTSLYSLSTEEAAFFKAQTGIDDDEDLKKHILEVAPYPCIHNFIFLRLNLSRISVYEHILKLGRERSDALLLDIGCCFGIDARKAAADGFPAKNIIASDIFNVMNFFKTTPVTYPGCFLPGDVFDPSFLSITAPSDDVSPPQAIDLSSLKSLNPLHGRISAINAISFFHLFNEEKQLYVAKALAGLLSAQPGSVICGYQVGSPEKGMANTSIAGSMHQLFAHSPKTWTSLWDGEVFEKGSVKVETELVEVAIREVQFFMMKWSVVRL
ncbi:hypothetical protein EDD22DRAFT_1004571 [Suillus occidentalis]|nr:hypothetical protein EDD22DRAFT_1004571 [Suillus occidentalis]